MLHQPTTFANGFPHELFAELRATNPVAHFDHPNWPDGYWALSRHADVQRVSRDSASFQNAPSCFLLDGSMPEDNSGVSELLINQDPPLHTKLRKLISRGFTPRRVAALGEGIQRRLDGIFAGLADRDACDLVDDIAMWLPLHVIADLVGVPEADRRQIFEWTELTFGFDPTTKPEERGAAAAAMFSYADAMCQERTENPRDDLMSILVAADVDGEQLTQMQIDLFFMLLQNAGSETTRNLITTGTILLLERPDDMARLRNDLDLLPTAVEELLRWVSPVIQFVRHARTDIVIGDTRIGAGDRVVLVYPSANRDDDAFVDASRLDISRHPNDHVAFGAGGPHFCLGASLARMEAKLMFTSILTRFVGLRVDGDVESLPRVHSNLIDGYSRVPIAWDRIT